VGLKRRWGHVREIRPSLPTLGQQDLKVKEFVVEKEVPFKGCKIRD
jgi:hypothetical protein